MVRLYDSQVRGTVHACPKFRTMRSQMMTNRAISMNPIYRRLRISQLAARIFWCVLSVVVWTSSCGAEGWPSIYAKQSVRLPETILVPMKLFREEPGYSGWILTYQNTPSGEETPDREHQSRSVTVRNSQGELTTAQISWEILRTSNDKCETHADEQCFDSIRILEVPEGFLTTPGFGDVPGGQGLRLFIVPAAAAGM